MTFSPDWLAAPAGQFCLNQTWTSEPVTQTTTANGVTVQAKGSGASLRGVDCAANAMAQAAFNNLFANGAMGTTLTLALTLFVALALIALGLASMLVESPTRDPDVGEPNRHRLGLAALIDVL